MRSSQDVAPAQAGIELPLLGPGSMKKSGIPAFAGLTRDPMGPMP